MPKPTFRKKVKDDNSSIVKFSSEKISVGDIRKTQMITTFGVGSIVDFKDYTVIIASTDDWDYNPNDIEEVENRKIFNENLSVITGAEYFLMPRTRKNTNSFAKGKNIASYVFPEKLHCSRCGNIYDFRELDIKDRHRCPQCRNNLNASRFIVVCARGHMDDFPYDWWVHNGKPCPSGVKSPRIKMINIYNRTDIDSLRLECTECKAARSMFQAFSENALSEFHCTCKHPHFKDPYARVQYGCHEKMRAILRSASGVYFPITKSALLIPPWSKKVVNYVQKNYGILTTVGEDKIVYAMRQYMRSIDDGVIEAARLETSSVVRVMITSVVPQIRVCIFAVVLFVFVDCWNMLEQPMLFLKNDDLKPLSVFIANAQSYTGNVLFPAAVVFMIPVLLLYIFFNDSLEKGLTLGELL